MEVPAEVPISSSTTSLVIRQFGDFKVWCGDQIVPAARWGRQKTLLLLKLLLQDRGKVFTLEQLVEHLFPESDPIAIRKNLWTRIGELRRALEPDLKKGAHSRYVVHSGKGGYRFSDEVDCWLDTEIFTRYIHAADDHWRSGLWAEAAVAFQRAISLYRGDYLSEDLYVEWTHAPRGHFRATYINALEKAAHCHLQMADWREAIHLTDMAMRMDPYYETPYLLKMKAHYHAGDIREALQTYEQCVTALGELEVQPSEELRDLHIQMRQRRVKQARRWVPHNLPASTTSFIGREQDVVEISDRLAAPDGRLVTLIGPGGAGKTRLAIEVARHMQATSHDGIWLIRLDFLTEPERLPQLIVDSIGIRTNPMTSPTETLVRNLAHRNILFVLDNCEHIIEACAQLVARLLEELPNVRILATSREPLRVKGESIWPVTSLSVPPCATGYDLDQVGACDAIRLFVDRARATLPRFRLNQDNADSVVRICRRLDGLPLAIELAAARVRALSVHEIAERLNDRFRLLTDGPRTAHPRHHSLRKTVEWSYDSLTSDEQRLLCRLSVFADTVSLQAIEAVCGSDDKQHDTVTLLTKLIDKSLVQVTERAGETRYRLLETIRHFGEECIKQSIVSR